jgi:rSAM/selenodomain-associated transferase 1
MTERTLQCAREFRDRFEVFLEVRYEGGDEERMKTWLSDGLQYRLQGRGDLGDRMNRAFCEAFEEGVGRAVLVGTDCPGLTVGILNRAFGALRSHYMVLGPAKDGGYYLIGLRVAVPSLFSDIPWGTGKVLAQTKRIAEGLGLSVAFVDVLEDVDRIKDLRVWERFMKK